MAINTQKLLPGSSGSTLAISNKSAGSFGLKKSPLSTKRKRAKLSASVAKVAKEDKESFSGDTIISDFKAINKSVKIIDRSLKSILSTNNKILAEKNKQSNLKKKKTKENNLEKQTKKEEKGGNKNGISIRTPSFLDKILNFFFWTIAGNLLFKFLTPENIDKAKGFVSGIVSVGKFVGGIFVKTVEGLVNFIDFSYEKFDELRGFIENVGGEGSVKLFDKFSGMLNKVLNGAIILTILLSKSKGLGGRRGGHRGGSRGGSRGSSGRSGSRAGRFGVSRVEEIGGRNFRRSRVTGDTFSSGSRLANARIDRLQRAGRLTFDGTSATDMGFQQRKGLTDVVKKYADRYGRKKAIQRFGSESVSELGGRYARSGATNLARKGVVGLLGKGGTRVGLKFLKNVISPIAQRIPIIGGLIDFALNYFLFKEPLGRSAFAAIGSTIFGALGAMAGSIIPVVGNFIGGALGGLAGDMAGKWLYDTFFDKKKPVDTPEVEDIPEVEAKRTGGTVGRTLRSSGETQELRSFNLSEPSKTKEGKDIGGTKVIQRLFQDENKKKKLGPLSALRQLSEKFKEIPVIGRIMGAAIDIALGQLPSAEFFRDLAKTFLSFHFKLKTPKTVEEMSTSMSRLIPKLEEGGQVGRSLRRDINDKPYTMLKTLETNLETAIRQDVTNSIDVIRKQLGLNPIGENTGASPNGSSPSSFLVGPAGSSGDKLTMARNLMRDLGLTAEQAAGIVGNMAAESGVENGRPQGSRPGTKGALKVDGVTGYGIVQWTSKNRQQALYDYAKSKGHDMSKPLTMDIEYQFFLKELKGPLYANVLKQIKDATDVKQSSTIFMQQYEVPAGHRTNAKIMERYNLSKPIAEALGRGEGKATTGNGTYIRPINSVGFTQLSNNPDAIKGSKLAGELGRYLDSQGLGAFGSGVHRHPEHRPWEPESGHSQGSLHYRSQGARAIDIGGFGRSLGYDDQEKILAAISAWNRKKGVSPVQLLADGDPGHNNHVHVAYAGGGEIQTHTKDPNKYNSLQSYQNYGGGQSTAFIQKIYIKT